MPAAVVPSNKRSGDVKPATSKKKSGRLTFRQQVVKVMTGRSWSAKAEDGEKTHRPQTTGLTEMPDSMRREVFYGATTAFEDPDEKREANIVLTKPTRSLSVIVPHWKIHPNNPKKQTWDLVLMVIILYSVVMVPYRICFGVEAEGAMGMVEGIFDLFFAADLLLNFFTAYEDSKTRKPVWGTKRIAINYLRTWFFIDFFSTVPFDRLGKLMMNSDSADAASSLRTTKLLRTVRLIKLVRLLRLLKLEELFESAAEVLQIDARYLLFGVLMFQQIFFAHLVACVWYGISNPMEGELMKDNHQTWVWAKDMVSAPSVTKYMYSLYWAFATMTTVGYGDVSAVNDTERVVSIFLMTIGVTIFGYNLFMVCVVIVDGDPRDVARKKKTAMISRFVMDKQLPKALAFRVRQHFEDMFGFTEDSFEEPFLKFLHPTMYSTVVNACYRHWPDEISFFSTVEAPVKARMFKAIVPCVVTPKEQLFSCGDIGTQCYFVYRGGVELKLPPQPGRPTGRTFCVLIDDGMCGEVSIVTARPRVMAAHARATCYLAFVNKKDIVEISQEYPSLWLALKKEAEIKIDLVTQAQYKDEQKKQPDLAAGPVPVDVVAIGGGSTENKGNETEDGDNDVIYMARRNKFGGDGHVKDGVFFMEPNASIAEVGAMMWKKHKLIFPRLMQKIVWDLTLALFILYSVASVPYRMGYGIPANGGWVVVDAICDMFFTADIIITFRTTVTNDDGAYLLSGTQVACSYVKGWFAIDFFSTVPIDRVVGLFGGGGDSFRSLRILRALRLVKLLKLLRLFKLKRLLGSHAKKVALPPMVADFFKNLFVLVFFAHLMSCVWYGGGLAKYNEVQRDGVTFSKTNSANQNVTTYRLWACEARADAAVDASPDFSGCVPTAVGIPTSWTGTFQSGNVSSTIMESASISYVLEEMDDAGDFSIIIPEKGQPYFNSTLMPEHRKQVLEQVQVASVYNFTNTSWNTSEGDSWLVWTGTADLKSPSDRYWASVYWCFATFLAVGYGDIYATSTNNLEIFIAVLAMSFGTIAFAMFISAVVNLVDDTLEQNGSKDKIMRVKDYLNEYNLPQGRIRKVKKEFKEYTKKRCMIYDDSEILGYLPTFLRDEVIRHAYNKDVIRFPMFKDVDTVYPGFLGEIVTRLMPTTGLSGDCIIEEGQSNRCLYMVLNGKLDVLDTNMNCLRSLHIGDWFGESHLVMPPGVWFQYKVSVQVVQKSEMFYMTREQWEEMADVCPDVTAKMMEMFDPEKHFAQMVKILEIEEQSGMQRNTGHKESDDKDSEKFNARSTHMASKATMAEFKLMNEGVSLTALKLSDKLAKRFTIGPALAHLTEQRANASVLT